MQEGLGTGLMARRAPPFWACRLCKEGPCAGGLRGNTGGPASGAVADTAPSPRGEALLCARGYCPFLKHG